MRKRKLKKFVVPSVMLLLIASSFFGIALINNSLMEDISNYDYSASIMKDVTQAVMKETKDDSFIKPFYAEDVEISINYYQKDSDEATRSNSLIFYENTYMPSSGIFYTSDKMFDVVAVYDGTVTNIKQDDVLGTVVEISHNSNLTTYYYSLTDVNLKVNDTITAGSAIGLASTNKILDKYTLLFEVYYQGKSINPIDLYVTDPSELR